MESDPSKTTRHLRHRQRYRKAAPGRMIVRQSDRSVVSFNDGFAEGEPEPHAPASVRDLVLSCVEHFKYMRLYLIRYAGSVIADTHNDIPVHALTANRDLRSLRCVLYLRAKAGLPLLSSAESPAPAYDPMHGVHCPARTSRSCHHALTDEQI